jgi:hypothetical protein
MAKRKITVTVDAELIDNARRLGVETLSGLVNEALAAHVEVMARREALGDLLAEWEQSLGPIGDRELAAARSVFDHLDGVGEERAS